MTKRLELLKNMLAEDPNDSFLLFAIAKEYESMDDTEQAIAHYTKLQSNDADYVGLYYHLGKIYEELEEQSKALETYKTGIEVAKKIKDQHALSELKGVLLNLELEL